MSIILLSYLLAFVQLTWQVGFHQFLTIFMESINIGPANIRGYVGGTRGGVGGGKSVNKGERRHN